MKCLQRVCCWFAGWLFAVVYLLLLPGCEEVGPAINLGKNSSTVSDTTYVELPAPAAEAKNVLIEEFTGVRCPNCPQGHDKITTIKANHPGRVVSVSLHPINSLGHPYPFSAQDLTNQEAQTLFDYLGQIGIQPAAGIDRMLFSGETKILLDRSKWESRVNQQINAPTPVNLSLSKTYDADKRELKIVAELRYTSDVSELNKLTVMLTESNIVTAQLDGSEIDTFYVHKDVMRDVVSETQGDLLNAPLVAGRVFRKVYRQTLAPAWKPENMHIVAFVHEYVNSKKVYQVKKINVQ
ncbi:MAG: Omp28-related outer membrane protein [Chitinophagales bacterium]|nr:Omp28-related outer membrane protein [Chitinophagales bacterium]MDW8418735.1 Omp28-related outer membrane protein [Chitinophagales bacterium]